MFQALIGLLHHWQAHLLRAKYPSKGESNFAQTEAEAAEIMKTELPTTVSGS